MISPDEISTFLPVTPEGQGSPTGEPVSTNPVAPPGVSVLPRIQGSGTGDSTPLVPASGPDTLPIIAVQTGIGGVSLAPSNGAAPMTQTSGDGEGGAGSASDGTPPLGTGTSTNSNASGMTSVNTTATPIVPIPAGSISDQGNSGVDATALTGLLSLFQGAFGNGGTTAGASAPGELVATPATGGTISPDAGAVITGSTGLTGTSIVLWLIVAVVLFIAYKHFTKKGEKGKSGGIVDEIKKVI